MREHGTLPDANIAMVNHELLAEMVGTTRSRIAHFMNKFRTMGLIDYDNEALTVRTELLTGLVLNDYCVLGYADGTVLTSRGHRERGTGKRPWH